MLVVLKNMDVLQGGIAAFLLAYMVKPGSIFWNHVKNLLTDLMKLNRNKCKYYQRGLRVMELILSAS